MQPPHCNTEATPKPAEQEKSVAESLYELIRKQPFFSGMEEGHLKLLADSAMRTQFDAGKTIFQKGDPANRFYLILAGSVMLGTTDKNGGSHRLQRIGPGDVLGWSWLFPPFYWNFDAVATQRTEAIFFYGSRLRAECQKDRNFGYELMKRVSEVVVARLQTTRQCWVEEK
jgi:CRP-like cAMP-binding protein